MRKTKILYIHHGKGLGGAPLSLLYLIQALDKSRFDPEVLFLHKSEAIDLFKNNGIKIAGVVNLHDFSHTKVWWFRWYHIPYLFNSIKDSVKTFHSAAAFWLDRIQPDIVHLNTSSLIAWGMVAYKKKIPVIWHIREPLADGYLGLRKYLIKKCVEKYAHTIVPICKHDAMPWNLNPKTHVVYNAVNSDIFKFDTSSNDFLLQHQLDPSTPKILFLGGLSYEKGTDVILKVFANLRLRLPQAKLLVAGYFDQSLVPVPFFKKFFPAHKFKKLALDLYFQMDSNVILIGAIKNIPQAMAACDVVVFPANFGHFARPVIEAGFMKKPVIASNFAPLDELVIDGKTGYLLSPSQIKQWTDKLYLLLTNKELNTEMGQAGYEFCTSNFSIENQIKIIESIYKSTQAIK